MKFTASNVMKKPRIGIDNYGLYPLKLDPLETLEWAKNHGAEGVQFSGIPPEEKKIIDKAYLQDLAQFAAANDLYLEWGGGQHIPYDMESWKQKDILNNNRKAAEEAALLGTRIVRSCSGGLMRWNSASPMTETLLAETAKALRSQCDILKDYNVILAIETHFEFTTHELLRLFEKCEAEPGEYLGICLDTMNLLTMLEDPILATERILPYVVSTHIKDGGVILKTEGLVSFPAEIGKGVIDLRKIIRRLSHLPNEVRLSIEDHGGSVDLPIFDSLFLSKFPDLTPHELARIIRLSRQTEEALQAGRCAVTPREEWPKTCESRLSNDIRTLKNMVR